MTTYGIPADEASIRIGIVQKNDSPYWDMMNAGVDDCCRKLGICAEVLAPEFEDVAAQERLAVQLIESGVDALAYTATDPDSTARVVALGRQAGIPVSAIDLDSPASGRLMYVGTLLFPDLGRIAGELMLRHLGDRDGGTVILQTGTVDAPGATGKLAGFTEVLVDAGFEVVGGDNDGESVDIAYRNALKLLEQHPHAVGMHGAYAYHPIVQARAIADAGLTGRLRIVGHDALPETIDLIESGEVAATIWVREYYFGYHTASVLHAAIVHGEAEIAELMGFDPETPEAHTRRLRPQVIDAETVAQFREWQRRHAIAERTRRSGIDVGAGH